MTLNRIARLAGAALVAGAVALGMWTATSGAVERAVVIPAPAVNLPQEGKMAKAVFAGGCFWGVQGVFQHVKGVTMAVSGYSGGTAETADYGSVSSGITKHAEAVEITYDPSVVSYGDLLQIFFSVVQNPTQLNYQGPDHGPQYRSAIFFQSEEERAVAEAYMAQLDAAKVYPAPIVTALEPFEAFYAAEQYHQDFLTLNPTYPYIVYHDIPKVEALQALFPEDWREEPVLVGTL